MDAYFSDRERGPKPRVEETISPAAWGGLVALIQSLIAAGAFGMKFPETCPDGIGIIGNDENALSLTVRAEIPGIAWPLVATELAQDGFTMDIRSIAPDTFLVLDLIEFCYRTVAKPIKAPRSYHSFFAHHHLDFEVEEGRSEFRVDINRIFSRNNLAYELAETGLITRLAPAVLRESLSSDVFHTGDTTLDAMLENSRTKFLSPVQSIRLESLERLWDCWERLKSLDNSANKKLSIASLLHKAASDADIREMLNVEALKLTEIGNSFHIRHTEITQKAITDPAHIDYLFHRLYCMIHLLLRKRDPIGKSVTS